MKIPGLNGIKKTIDANKIFKTAQADYQQKHAEYVEFAGLVQQDVYELGEARVVAIRTLGAAVKVIGKEKMGAYDGDGYQIPRDEMVKIEQQSDQLARLASGSLVGALAADTIANVGAYGARKAIASLSKAAASKGTLATLGSALPTPGVGVAVGAAVLAGVTVIGAEVIGAKTEEKADEALERFRLETAKIDLEMARLRAIQLRSRELKTATMKRTEELNVAMLPTAKTNWFARMVAAVKRLFTGKGQYDDAARIAKSLSAIIEEPVVTQEEAK